MDKQASAAFKNPFYQFNDLKTEDIHEDKYVDPYYYLRRPIEPERLKLIYQQAFIYDLLYKFAKEHLPDVQNASKERPEERKVVKSDEKNLDVKYGFCQDKATDTVIDNIKEKVLEYLFKNQVSVSDAKPAGTSNAKPAELSGDDEEQIETLWGTDDLNILRKEFTKIKENNFLLRSKMMAIEAENIKLKEKYELLVNETKGLPNDLKTMEKCNERLYIRVQDLESRYINYSKEIEQMDAEMRKNQQELSQAKQACEALKSEKLSLEYEISKYELKTKSLESELKLYYDAKLDRVRLRYTKEIVSLTKKLAEVRSEQSLEKSQHEKTKKALDHLRTHYMTNFGAKSEQHASSSSRASGRIDDRNIKIL